MDIKISKKNWDLIINYAASAYDQFKCEIGGMAVLKTILDKDNNVDHYEIREPVIVKQEIAGTTCEMDKDALAEYYTKTAMRHNNRCRFVWWHSHHKMGAFWSGTDLSTIEEMDSGDWSVALVVNLKEEYKLRVSVWKPIEMHKDIDLDIVGNDKEIPEAINKEVKALCVEETRVVTGMNYNKEYNPYGYNTGQTTLFRQNTEKHQLESIETALDYAIDSYKIGERNFKKYKRKIKEMNTTLKEKKVPYRIASIKKSDLDEHFTDPMSSFPAAVLIYGEDEKFNLQEALMEFQIYEADYDTHVWNESFYNGGR
jgi:hypothetical protein